VVHQVASFGMLMSSLQVTFLSFTDCSLHTNVNAGLSATRSGLAIKWTLNKYKNSPVCHIRT